LPYTFTMKAQRNSYWIAAAPTITRPVGTPPRHLLPSRASPSIAFRQNITIQFCSNLLPVEREEAGNPHPCVSVSIRGQIACFLWRSVSFRSLVFGPRMDTDTHG